MGGDGILITANAKLINSFKFFFHISIESNNKKQINL